MKLLWKHQEEAVTALLASPEKRCYAEVTVGGGKAIIAAELAKRFKGRTLILVPNTALLMQNGKACLEQELPHGLLGNGLRDGLDEKTVVATPNSAELDLEALGHFGLIVVDEAHYIRPEFDDPLLAGRIRRIFSAHPNALVRGLTGTAYRTDTGSLEATFGPCVFSFDYRQGLEAGVVKPIISAGDIDHVLALSAEDDVEVAGARIHPAKRAIKLAPLHAAEIARRMSELRIRKALIVCVNNTRHADAVAQELTNLGVRAAAAHSKQPERESERNIRAFRRGDLQALASCSKFTVGFDVHDIDCVVLLRASGSKVLYGQALGRGVRAPRKIGDPTYCVVLDFGLNAARLGRLDDDMRPLSVEEVRATNRKIERINAKGRNQDDSESTGGDLDEVLEDSVENSDPGAPLDYKKLLGITATNIALCSVVTERADATPVSECDEETIANYERKFTEARKEKDRERTRKWLADPENREMNREMNRKWLADPENRAKMREAKRKWLADPENRAKMREAKRKWIADPENREKHRETNRKRLADPEKREAERERARKWRANPEKREAERERARKWRADPEKGAKIRERRRRNYAEKKRKLLAK